jgi:putative nucleotidyltransferase with HDIG domain
MAGIKLTLVRSRVGRRVAVLFAVCGLAPALVLAGVTIWSVSEHLHDREQARLRELAKESTMAAFERLLDVDERLRTTADPPQGAMSLPRLDAAARARLAEGKSVLLLPSQAGTPLTLVVPAAGSGDGERAPVAVALDARTLWALDDRASDGSIERQVCVAIPPGLVLGCTDGHLDPAATRRLREGHSGAGTFATDEWMGAFWSAPMQTHFGVPHWTGVVATRTADALAPSRALARTIGLVVAAALCTVLLVSLRQIRRLLDPIASLHDGTARLARGAFETRVRVRTGDELQALGESFNAMAAELERQFGQLHALSVGTLEALARAIDAKSPWTAGHSTRVADVAVAIAHVMRFDAARLERVRRGALLHDIGKIAIGAEILDKPAALTPAEFAIVREHPATGARILEPLPHCADILPMVLQHHERLDGRGYPGGLVGDAISLEARVLMVADVYDAMTSDRPYRRGLLARDVAAFIAGSAGTHFDADVVEAFLEAFRCGRIPMHADEMHLDQPA